MKCSKALRKVAILGCFAALGQAAITSIAHAAEEQKAQSRSADGHFIEVTSVEKSTNVPGAPTAILPGYYFLTIVFQTDDPKFSWTSQPSQTDEKRLCGVVGNGASSSSAATGTSDVHSRDGSVKLDTCIFSVPNGVAGGMRFSPDGYPAIDIKY